MAKGDFFPLFWRAWEASFTPKLIQKSFESTGIWPPDRSVVLDRFVDRATKDAPAAPQALREASRSQLNRLLRSAVADPAAKQSKALSVTLHSLAAQNKLLQDENKGLREAIITKRRHKKRGKKLPLATSEDYHGGAVFWSPRKLGDTRERLAQQEQEKEAEQLAKATKKQLQDAQKLITLQQKKQRWVAREAAKQARERERAAKVAAREAKNAAQNTRKAIQTSQSDKRKASKAPTNKPKAKRARRAAAAVVAAPAAVIEAPPKLNSRGRSIRLPRKYN